MEFSAHLAYLFVNAGCITFPFLLSFERRVGFIRKWKAILTGIFLMMAVFIPWDIAFTRTGIWGFNPEYITGIRFLHLPLEEWLFFICIPYACLFTYECVRYFRPRPPSPAFTKTAGWLVVSLALGCALTHIDKWYTLVACMLCAALLTWHLLRDTAWLGWLLITWLILLVPFYLSNGILTGLSFWHFPIWNTRPEGIRDYIVWYNNTENLGIRIWSVPADDFFYGLLMVLLSATGYEGTLRRQNLSQIPTSATTAK